MPHLTSHVGAPPVPPVGPSLQAAAPFSAGAVIGRSFTVWFRNFLPFSLVALVAHVPLFVLAASTPPEGGNGWTLATQLLAALADLVVTGALAHGVLVSLRGGNAGVGALFSTGFRKAVWVFFTSFKIGLWVLLGLVLLVVPAIVWYCALYVAVPAVVVEPDAGSTEALARSRELTKGHRWEVLAVVLVVGLTMVLAVTVAMGILYAATLSAVPHPIPSLIGTVFVALVRPLGACASAVAYHDLRVAKEGVATSDLVKVFE